MSPPKKYANGVITFVPAGTPDFCLHLPAINPQVSTQIESSEIRIQVANGDKYYTRAAIDCDCVAVGDEQRAVAVRRLQRRIEYASTTYGFGETPSPQALMLVAVGD